MIYLKEFSFPSLSQELGFLHPGDSLLVDWRPKLHTGSFYPFNVLPKVKLQVITFENITVLYGENGSGKTTALNIIAEKLRLKRDSLFNSGRFLNDYLDMCKYNEDDFREYAQFFNHNSKIITSDDVFNLSMKKREFNKQLFRKSNDVIEEYCEIRLSSPNLKSLEDFDRWHKRYEPIQLFKKKIRA